MTRSNSFAYSQVIMSSPLRVLIGRTICIIPPRLHPNPTSPDCTIPTIPFSPLLLYSSDNSGCNPFRPAGRSSA